MATVRKRGKVYQRDYSHGLVANFPILEDKALLDDYARAWLEGAQAFWNEIRPLMDKA